jgi:hypothetical protein
MTDSNKAPKKKIIRRKSEPTSDKQVIQKIPKINTNATYLSNHYDNINKDMEDESHESHEYMQSALGILDMTTNNHNSDDSDTPHERNEYDYSYGNNRWSDSEENPEEAPKEDPEEDPKDDPEEAPKEDPEGAPKDDPEENTEENTEEAPKDDPEENSEEAPKENPKDDPEENPKDDPEENLKDDPEKSNNIDEKQNKLIQPQRKYPSFIEQYKRSRETCQRSDPLPCSENNQTSHAQILVSEPLPIPTPIPTPTPVNQSLEKRVAILEATVKQLEISIIELRNRRSEPFRLINGKILKYSNDFIFDYLKRMDTDADIDLLMHHYFSEEPFPLRRRNKSAIEYYDGSWHAETENKKVIDLFKNSLLETYTACNTSLSTDTNKYQAYIINTFNTVSNKYNALVMRRIRERTGIH